MENTLDIILIDDDRMFCRQCEEYFSEKDDYNFVSAAHDGEKGLEIVKTYRTDVLLLDLILPHLDGIGVMEEVHDLGLHEDMTTIIVSAFMKEKIAARLAALGADYYILKPVKMKILDKRIRDLIFPIESSQTKREYMLTAAGSDRDFEDLNLETRVSQVLRRLGVPAHIKGYIYLREAIKLVIEDISLLGSVTKRLYPRVAENCDTTAERVERAIRHAIKMVCEDGDRDQLNRYLTGANRDNLADSPPGNSRFIAEVAEKIKIELNQLY